MLGGGGGWVGEYMSSMQTKSIADYPWGGLQMVKLGYNKCVTIMTNQDVEQCPSAVIEIIYSMVM